MKHICLITAKGSNTSIKDKNLINLYGKSLLGWQITAALNSKLIDEIFVSTECSKIKSEALKYGVQVIDRPNELSEKFTNHGDVILHGVESASKLIGGQIDTVTILLGNTIYNKSIDIDNCINKLMSDPLADSSMTVWEAQDDHPYRAMYADNEGYLRGFLDLENVDTNRQSYPTIYYYDQGPWCVRYNSLISSKTEKKGPACWWWMGKKCIPIVRNWVTGRDVHTQLDVDFSRFWLSTYMDIGDKNDP